MKTLIWLAVTLTSSLSFAAEFTPPGPQLIRNARPGSLAALKNRATLIHIATDNAVRNAKQHPVSLANQAALFRAQHAGFSATSYRQLSSWAHSTNLGTAQPGGARRK
jgi:hypothetical protein